MKKQMVSNLKALIIQSKPNGDLGDTVQVARAEGMKIFRNPTKIRVLEVVHSKYGEIAVVQNGESCVPDKQT